MPEEKEAIKWDEPERIVWDQPTQTQPVLTEERRTQLDNIVQQMIQNNEPESNIQWVVNDFKNKYGVQPTPAPKETWLGNLRRKAEIAMGGVNVGTANLAGMPVDIVNKIQSIFLPTSKEPVGGSEWIKKKMMIPPPTPEGFVEKTIGATAEQIPVGLATIASGGTVPMAARFVAGAGTGTGIARTVAPESPVAEFVGQVAGGLGAAKFPDLLKNLKGIGARKTIADLTEKVGGEMKPSLAGQSAQEWMEVGSQEARDYADTLYGQLRESSKGVQVKNYPETWKTLDEIPNSTRYKMLAPDDKAHIDSVIKTVKEQTSTPVRAGKPRQFTPAQQADLEKQVVEQFGIPAPPETSFDTAIGLKRGLGEQSYSLRYNPKGKIIRDIKDSVMQDMESAANQAGRSDVMSDLATADKFMSEQVYGQGRGATIQKFQKMSPEKLVDRLRTGSLNDVKAIKDMSGPEGFQDLKQGFVSDLALRNERSAVRISREARRLMSNRSEEMEVIFNPDEIEILKNMTNPGVLKTFSENNPNTYNLVKTLVMWGIIGGVGYRILRRPLAEFNIVR